MFAFELLLVLLLITAVVLDGGTVLRTQRARSRPTDNVITRPRPSH